MDNPGRYMYGVIPQFNVTDSLWDISDGVHTVGYRDISAIIGNAEMIDYSLLGGDDAARRLVRHQLVMEKVMQEFPVIPAKLGTVFLDDDEVVRALAKGYLIFKEVFKKVDSSIELDVVASLDDLNAVIKETAEAEDVRDLKQTLLSKKGGIAVEDQIRIGELIRSHLKRRKEEYACIAGDALKGLWKETKGYATQDDAMIMNSAYLVDKKFQSRFEEKLEELAISFLGKIHFKCVGPLPPYNFYMIEIKRFCREEIDGARKRLGLPEFATKDDIKSAYRKHALACHPDRRQDREDGEMEYDQVTKAYKLLVEYCQEGLCSFDTDGLAGNSMIVQLRE